MSNETDPLSVCCKHLANLQHIIEAKNAEITRLKATSAKLWDIAASSIDPPERRRMLDRLGMDSFAEDG